MSFFSCKTKYPKLETVKELDINKYLGTWYEIARLPNSFEIGLECVTANYSLLENGKIQVLNKGYLIEDNSKFKTAKGKAYIPDKNEPAKLKVTFFWPFYGDYWVLALDENYQYAMVGDESRKYLWILARKNSIDNEIYLKLIKEAKSKSFDVEKMIKVNQECSQH